MIATFESEIWIWAGSASWFFVTLPKDVSEDVRAWVGDQTRGFGSVRVEVKVGITVWQTSLFPDKQSGCFVLPVKAAVRKAEGLLPGISAVYQIQIL